jgi:hypothetical protein
MMAFRCSFLKALIVTATLSYVAAESEELLANENFWNRYLTAGYSFRPTHAPVKPPTLAPVKPPTPAPIKPPTPAPVKPPTPAPVKPPTPAPVKPPTPAPVKPPTPAPVKPPVPVPVPVPPVSPPNVCLLQAGIACVVPGTNQQCSALEGERDLICRCNDCASELDFRYTARKCTPAEVTAGICTDFGAAPLPSRVNIVINFGAAIFFNGQVVTNQDTVLDPGNFTNGTSRCLTSELSVTISDLTGTLRQQLQINSRCQVGNGAGNFALLDSQGALTFSGYTCRESPNNPNRCFVPIRYDVTARNAGPTEITVTNFTFTFQGATSVITTNSLLGPGSTIARSQPAEIGLCQSGTTVASTRVTGVNGFGTQCPAAEAVSTTTITVAPRPQPPAPAPVLPPVAAKMGMMLRRT